MPTALHFRRSLVGDYTAVKARAREFLESDGSRMAFLIGTRVLRYLSCCFIQIALNMFCKKEEFCVSTFAEIRLRDFQFRSCDQDTRTSMQFCIFSKSSRH